LVDADMSNSLLNKGSILLNAIAITLALSVLSGGLPSHSLSRFQFQSILNLSESVNLFTPDR
jgi:hypothetical protein